MTKGSTFSLSNHKHTTTIAADSGTNQLTLAASTKYKLTAGETNFIFTTPPNTDRYVNSAAFTDDSTNKAASPVKMTLTRAGSDSVTIVGNIPKVSSSSAGVAPKGAAVSTQSQSTKFLREDGSWAAPSYPTVNNASLTLKGAGTTVTTFTANASTNQSLDIVAGTNVTITPDATNHKITIASTAYSANNGVGLSGTTFYNSGVRAVSTGSANGTISVNTNGISDNVAVKGLGSAAYTASTSYVPINGKAPNGIGRDGYVAYAHDGFLNTGTGTVTGALVITTPFTKTKGEVMLKFTVDIYNYKSNTSVEYKISGYAYNDGKWYNCTAYCVSSGVYSADNIDNLTVRFGYVTDGFYQVQIGETSTNKWNYPRINVHHINVTYSRTNYTDANSGWSLEFVTSGNIPNITQTITNTAQRYLPFEKVTTAADADTYAANTGWYNWNTTSGTNMPTTNYGILLTKEYPSVQMFLPDTGTAIYLRKKTNASTAGTSWMGITGTAGNTYNLSNFYNSTTSRTANTVLAAPNGSDGAATFRKLVAADIPSLSYLPLTGGNVSGGISYKSTKYDGSAANNGVSSGSEYPTTFNILDKSSRILVRLEGVINSTGAIGSYWYIRNYNTSGTQVAQKGISMSMTKDGTFTYAVSDGANFRSAIGAGTSSLVIGTTATTAAAGNHTHNYAGSSSAGGAATSANKLTTARTITLGNEFQGSASFDGSANITISGSHYRVQCSGQNKANYPWHRIAYCSGKTDNNSDTDAIIDVWKTYDGGGYGRIKISLRTNAAGAGCSASAKWIYRYGFAADDIKIARWGVTGNSVYADVFLKCGIWPRVNIVQIHGNRAWTLVASSEVKDTTSSDKKGSVEVYKTIEAAATELHNQAYTEIEPCEDVAYTRGVAIPRTGSSSDANSFPGKNLVTFTEWPGTSTNNTPTEHFYHILRAQGDDTRYGTQLALGMTVDGVYYRKYSNEEWINWQPIGRFTATPTSGQVVVTDGTAGGVKSSGYTIAKSVPSNAVFTDTTVTSSANHYTPATASGQNKTASASGATAAWSIDVVKGVTLNTDGKGHVTGLSVTSGKIPANPNTDTKVNVSLATTSKAYLLATTTTPTSTAAAVTSIADTGVYLGTTAGSLYATSFYENGTSLTNKYAPKSGTPSYTSITSITTVVALRKYTCTANTNTYKTFMVKFTYDASSVVQWFTVTGTASSYYPIFSSSGTVDGVLTIQCPLATSATITFTFNSAAQSHSPEVTKVIGVNFG